MSKKRYIGDYFPTEYRYLQTYLLEYYRHLLQYFCSSHVNSFSNRRLRICPMAEIHCGTHKRKNLLTKFVPVVKLTKKRRLLFIIGSLQTLSTTTTAIHSSNTLMFARHCKPNKVFALTFPICSPHFAVVRTFRAMLLTEYPIKTALIGTLGTACTITALGGMWI